MLWKLRIHQLLVTTYQCLLCGIMYGLNENSSFVKGILKMNCNTTIELTGGSLTISTWSNKNIANFSGRITCACLGSYLTIRVANSPRPSFRPSFFIIENNLSTESPRTSPFLRLNFSKMDWRINTWLSNLLFCRSFFSNNSCAVCDSFESKISVKISSI